MTTSRIKNYLKNNPDRVEAWKNKILKLQIVKELTNKYGGDELKDSENFNTKDITDQGGQNKICDDLMYDHFELASGSTHRSSLGYDVATLHVYYDVFDEMIKDIGVKPVFPTIDVEKKSETDIYALAKGMCLQYLVYIYHNQDEFCYVAKDNPSRYNSSSKAGLGIFFKEQREEASKE